MQLLKLLRPVFRPKPAHPRQKLQPWHLGRPGLSRSLSKARAVSPPTLSLNVPGETCEAHLMLIEALRPSTTIF